MIWLQNLEAELGCAQAHSAPTEYFKLVLATLNFYGVFAERWLDTHHVVGNSENRQTAERIAQAWKHFDVDWRQIVEQAPCAGARSAGIRLAGLGLL